MPADVARNPSLDLEIARDIVRVQAQEVEVRRAELENERSRDAESHEYSLEALRVQAELIKGDREVRDRQSRRRWMFAGVAMTLLLAFFCYAIHAGRDALVVEALKTLTAFALGGAGGYAVGRGRRPADGGSDDTQGG